MRSEVKEEVWVKPGPGDMSAAERLANPFRRGELSEGGIEFTHTPQCGIW